jgi:PadR family transcriptional regulator PadR
MNAPPTIEALLVEVLAAGPLHGYGAIARIRERSGGELDFPEGTVYPALHRLERAGQIRSTMAIVDGRSRRLYELTDEGRRARTAHRAAWRSYSAAIDALLGGRRVEVTT